MPASRCVKGSKCVYFNQNPWGNLLTFFFVSRFKMVSSGVPGVQVGKGANMKLVVNMIMGTMMTTLAEGLTLAQKAGLEQKQLVEVLGLGVMNCPLFAMKVRSSQHCASFFPV